MKTPLTILIAALFTAFALHAQTSSSTGSQIGNNGMPILYRGELPLEADLAGISEGSLLPGQMYYVSPCLYTWDPSAPSGDLQPTNATGTTGWWIKNCGEDALNELQTLSISGNSLSISLGNTVPLPNTDTDVSAVDLILTPATDTLTMEVIEDGVTYSDALVITGSWDWTPNNIWHDTDEAQERFYFATDGTTYYRSGDDHQFRNDSNQSTFHIDALGNVGIGAVTAPRSHLHFPNTVSDAGGTGDFGAVISPAQNDGFDDWSEYKTLLYQGGTPAGSYGIGIESGSLVLNSGSASSSGWIANRFGGNFISGVRGDGYERNITYGQGLKDNGAPVSVLMPDAQGWMRERAVSTGARLQQSAYGGNWMWGGWTTVSTADTGLLDRGWETAYTFTAPSVPTGYAGTFDARIDGNFGRMIHYGRECRLRSRWGWRVLVNGVNVGTRDGTFGGGQVYRDFRTNLGNETNLEYLQEEAPSFHWTRNAVPAGATVEVQFRHRHQQQGSQTNAYGRIIVGYGREANVTFLPNKTIVTN